MAASSSRAPAPSHARRTIATYPDYRDAERAVDWLSDQGFDVGRLAIVGTGLKYVEQVAGRVTTARAALTGAGQGAMIGLLFAALFGLFFAYNGFTFLGVLAYGVVLGAIFGAVFGAIAHVAQGGRRDFASVAGTQAERYEVEADDPVADEAASLLGAMPAAPR